MSELLYIILNISLPIIIMILAGFGFIKVFKFDMTLIIKLNVYVMLPALLFLKIFTIDFPKDLIIKVVPYALIFMAGMFALSQLFSLIMHYKKPMRKAIGNVFMLSNVGNYGIPLIELAFPGAVIAMAAQLIMIIVQNVFTSTFVVYQASSGKSTVKQSLKNVIKMPALYAIVVAIALRSMNVTLPNTIYVPIDYIADAFVALALLTLGMRLGEIESLKGMKNAVIGAFIRTFLATTLAFGIVKMLGITGILAQSLIIGVSTPAAVNSAILAKEFDNEADFSAQTVVATTVLCTFTLPLVIFLVPKIL